jgi:predicted PolB exonuclease-like 3'-5' exonuclease
MIKKTCVIDVELNSTDMWSGRVICISILDVDRPDDIKVFHDQMEEELIMNFLKFFNKKKFQKICAYNAPYDHQVIISRCLKYRLHAGIFYDAELVDLMQILKGKKFNYNRLGKLQDWSAYILNKKKLEKEASVAELDRQGKLEQIIQYNMNDVILAYELFKRIDFCLGA